MEPFLTYALDVFVVLPETAGGLVTLPPIYEVHKARGCETEGECILIEGMPAQYLPAYNPLLEEALAEARETSYGETTTRVLRPEHLAAIMIQTGRDKNRQRFSAFMKKAVFDDDYLREIVERYQLTERFNQWNPKT